MRILAAKSHRYSPIFESRYAVAVVHHARKEAGNMRAGRALRGSSEFHAWGDSNLYLRRNGDDRITLYVEHRAASSIPAMTLELIARGDALAVDAVDRRIKPAIADPTHAIDSRIAAALAEIGSPRPFADLRAACRMRAATLYERLAAMTNTGRIVKSAEGYHLTG